MPRNRVEQLESTVAELESTVQGLTKELVEAKERIRVLEAELDTGVPTRVPERRVVEQSPTADDEQAPVESSAAAEEQAEANKPDEAASKDEAASSGLDDIIVA